MRRKGFTLLELLTAVAISAVVMLAIGMTFVSQVRQYQVHAGRRASQANARTGIAFLEKQLRAAGYGVDPHLAIMAFDGYQVLQTNGTAGYPDAITIYRRDPLFRRRLTATPTAGQLDIAPPLTEELRAGQVLLVMCNAPDNPADYAYVVVGANTPAGSSTISLASAVGFAETPITAPGNRYRQNAKLGNPCFTNTADRPYVMKVDRYSFFVQAFDDDGDNATAPVPYLMLHRGIDIATPGGVDEADAVPIAAGVEQLQLAYVMNADMRKTAPPAILGVNNPNEPPFGEAWDADGMQPGRERPAMKDSYTDAKRFTSNPANVRLVRATLVVRGTMREETLPGDDYFNAALVGPTVGTGPAWRQMENVGTPAAPFVPEGGNYVRSIVRLAVAPKNLLMRSQFTPPAEDGG